MARAVEGSIERADQAWATEMDLLDAMSPAEYTRHMLQARILDDAIASQLSGRPIVAGHMARHARKMGAFSGSNAERVKAIRWYEEPTPLAACVDALEAAIAAVKNIDDEYPAVLRVDALQDRVDYARMLLAEESEAKELERRELAGEL